MSSNTTRENNCTSLDTDLKSLKKSVSEVVGNGGAATSAEYNSDHSGGIAPPFAIKNNSIGETTA